MIGLLSCIRLFRISIKLIVVFRDLNLFGILAWSCLRWCFAFREFDWAFFFVLIFKLGVFFDLNSFDVADIFLVVLFFVIFMDNVWLFLKLDLWLALSVLDPNSIWVLWTLARFIFVNFSFNQVWLTSSIILRQWRLCDAFLILSQSLTVRIINRPSIFFQNPFQNVWGVLVDLAQQWRPILPLIYGRFSWLLCHWSIEIGVLVDAILVDSILTVI